MAELCAAQCKEYLKPEDIEPHHKYALYKTYPGGKFLMDSGSGAWMRLTGRRFWILSRMPRYLMRMTYTGVKNVEQINKVQELKKGASRK